jgi:hypothetical protein
MYIYLRKIGSWQTSKLNHIVTIQHMAINKPNWGQKAISHSLDDMSAASHLVVKQKTMNGLLPHVCLGFFDAP